jgi:hypothetical protein
MYVDWRMTRHLSAQAAGSATAGSATAGSATAGSATAGSATAGSAAAGSAAAGFTAAGSKAASTTVPVHPLLAERWSPRGFDQEHELGEQALTALLEAARWAPSAQNSQPWRFLVTRRGEQAHGQLFSALAAGNQAWAGAASALVLPGPLAVREAAPRTRQPVGDLLLPVSLEPALAAA